MIAIPSLPEHALLPSLGWVFLHFLWQGTLALAAVGLTFRLAVRASSQARQTILRLALAASLLAALVTFLLIYPVSPAAAGGNAALSVLGVCWLVGAAGMGVILLVQVLVAQLCPIVGARAAPSAFQQRVAHMAGQLGVKRPPPLLESTLVNVPATVGCWRPVILAPRLLLYSLPERKLDAVLAHELAHIRRRDFVAACLESVVEALFFFHPVVWWMSRMIRAEGECCCDSMAADVLGDRRFYAETLYTLGLVSSAGPAIAVPANAGGLKWRIERVLGASATERVALWTAPALAGGALLVALLLAAAASAIAVGDRPATPEVLQHLDTPDLLYDPPHDFALKPHGRIAFRSEIRFTDCYQEFELNPVSMGTAVIQIVPETEGFQPFLSAHWPCLHLPEHSDGDLNSGRGGRPWRRIACEHGPPGDWLRFRVHGRHREEKIIMATEIATYTAVVWQPLAHNDIDPNVIGPEASPVLLDDAGCGELGLPRGKDPPPAIDYPTDIDVFQVRCRFPYALAITVDGTPGQLHPYLRVYDDCGVLLLTAPDRRQPVVHTTVHPAEDCTRLYFAVSAYDHSATGVYSVRVTESP